VTLVDHARTALGQAGDAARDYWRSSMSRIDPHRLLVAWQNPNTRRITLVGVLEHSAGRYCFRYLRAALDTQGFRPFPGFDNLRRRYESEQLFPLFRQRLMVTTGLTSTGTSTRSV
jgi:hypothetical protein